MEVNINNTISTKQTVTVEVVSPQLEMEEQRSWLLGLLQGIKKRKSATQSVTVVEIKKD